MSNDLMPSWANTFQDRRIVATLMRYGLEFDGRMTHRLPGQVIINEPDRQVIRMELPDHGEFYLKWSRGEKISRMVAMLCRLCRPMCAAAREAKLLELLRAAGLPAARPVGWAEHRIIGMPVGGFLVTEAVTGQSLDEVFMQADERRQRHLWAKLGRLMGHLHHHGFFHIVRLKDLIVASEPPQDGRLWQAGDLVLIDREVAMPRQRRFSRRRCFHALARCMAKLERAGHPLTKRHLATFIRAYSHAQAHRMSLRTQEMVHHVERFLRPIRRHRRYRGSARTLPARP